MRAFSERIVVIDESRKITVNVEETAGTAHFGMPVKGDGKDSCQILTQACDLDDKPGSDEAPARSRFLAVH